MNSSWRSHEQFISLGNSQAAWGTAWCARKTLASVAYPNGHLFDGAAHSHPLNSRAHVCQPLAQMAHVRASAAAHALLLLLLVVVAVARTAAAALNPAVLAGLPPLSPGEASVSSAKELLQALEDGVGDITLEGEAETRCSTGPHWLDRTPTALAAAAWSRRSPLRCARCLRRRLCAGQIVLTPEDWGQYDLPIQLAANSTVLIHWGELRQCCCSRQRSGGAGGHCLRPAPTCTWPQLHALAESHPAPLPPSCLPLPQMTTAGWGCGR
jgi:hypothetical protein